MAATTESLFLELPTAPGKTSEHPFEEEHYDPFLQAHPELGELAQVIGERRVLTLSAFQETGWKVGPISRGKRLISDLARSRVEWVITFGLGSGDLPAPVNFHPLSTEDKHVHPRGYFHENGRVLIPRKVRIIPQGGKVVRIEPGYINVRRVKG